ncbi:MAG: hypothetical protein KGM47_07520 [Acidobacteriota bacterium]|nr:hypothetical protein [Acidobacteriota bacterium]
MWETIGIIILCEIVAALLLLLRRVWPLHLRRDHNDLIGWQLSVLGTTYGVIVLSFPHGKLQPACWPSARLDPPDFPGVDRHR